MYSRSNTFQNPGFKAWVTSLEPGARVSCSVTYPDGKIITCGDPKGVLPHPSQAKPNPKIPNLNPGLGGFIITLNRRRRYRYRRRVLLKFSDFQYSNLNQI